MDDQKPATKDGAEAPQVPPPAEITEPIDAAPTKPATEQQLNAVEQQMTGFERATLRWAKAAVILSGLAAAFVCLQWWEMHTGGKDTHELAVSAGKQADRTKDLAGYTQTQAQQTQVLAQQMQAQAANTENLVKEATVQAQAAQASANAAQSAANTSIAGLRPWIKITNVKTRGEGPEIPALSFQRGENWPEGQSQVTFQLQISFKNVGHSPAKVSVDFETFLPLWKDGYANVIYQEKKRFCGEFAKKKLGNDPSLEITLFPDEPHEWYGGGAAIVNSKVINSFSDTGNVILPVVAVCINYQFGDSPKIYQTSALYEVFRKDNRSRFFEVGKGVPASAIFMERNEASDESY